MRQETFNRPRQFLILMRFHKPIGILLLLWPALWALWIASHGMPDPLILGIFVIGVVLMRAAGCVINDIADRQFDRHVERTRERPLTSGKLTLRAAIILFVVLYGAAFTLVCFLNALTIKLAIAAAALAVFYPFTKRFTHWPQLILGLAFSWSIPMAFAAVTNTIPPIAWWLFATCVLWTITYDTEYAMTDREDDLKIGLKSTAILFGQHDRLIIGLLQTAIVISLVGIGVTLTMHWPYYLSLAAAAIIFIYHQRLIAKREPRACFRAFLNNNWFGLIIFLGILLTYRI